MTAPVTRLPGSGPASPDGVARALLDGVVAWFGEHAPDPPLPARQYVAGGDPRAVAWDDTNGQVTVALGRIGLGLDATRPPAPVRVPRASPANHGAAQRFASFEVQIVRCVPVLSTPAVLNDHGLLVTADAGHLITAVLAVAKQGSLTRIPVAEAGVTVDDLVTLGPSGGAAAAAVSVTVPLL